MNAQPQTITKSIFSLFLKKEMSPRNSALKPRTKKTMKIAMVTNEFPSVSETFILNLITDFIDLGHQVDVFSLSKLKLDTRLYHKKILEYGLIHKTNYIRPHPKKRLLRLFYALFIIAHKIWFHHKEVRKCLDFKRLGVYYSLNQLFLAYPFMKKNYDIIHCQFGFVGSHLISLKDILSVPFVTSFHGKDITEFVTENGVEVYSDLFKKGDLFLPVSEYFKTKLIESGCPREKVQVIYTAIDINEFPYREKTHASPIKPIEFLSIGRFVEKKGIKYALSAFHKIKSQNKNIHYTIIGSGEKENELKQLVKTLGLEDCVTFTGYLPESEVKTYLQNADIFLLPSVTSEKDDKEGIPVVLKEAMAIGVPVISTFHSGIPELIQDGESGYLVAERSVEEIVEKIQYIMAHPKEVMQVRQNAREVICRNFDKQKLNHQLEQLYYQLITPDKG